MPGLLLLPILPNTTQTRIHRRLAASPDEWKYLLQILRKLMITILFANKDKYLKCLLLKTKHTNATIKEKTPLTGWTDIFSHLIDTEKQGLNMRLFLVWLLEGCWVLICNNYSWLRSLIQTYSLLTFWLLFYNFWKIYSNLFSLFLF